MRRLVPDIDVFHNQAREIGKLPQPFFIFSLRRDRELAQSVHLIGQREKRLSNIRDVKQIADLEVTVAAFSVVDRRFNVSKSPALIHLPSRIVDADAAFGRGVTDG